ncbi:hypothetical protein [Frigoribacterium sp. CFBP 8751]|uniref:hypothetical protein n=1 Tax=Frigoribacterium sp. CFBP 8751 TaxID=2775277 RepID=UPI0017803896|nr:hypothetical protein [Frigoribacterium sp. CFBP 8751]MBD8540595.1 hypothetical protein [Frigoribacterium sp. CFBP 8751]
MPVWVAVVAAAAAAAAAASVVAVIVGLSNDETPGSAPQAQAQVTSTPAASQSAQATVAPSTDDGPSEASALEVASSFVAAFTDRSVSGQEWEAGYTRYLTPRAQVAYEGTGQSRVPGTQVTGDAVLEAGVTAEPVEGDGHDEPSVLPAIVSVPTDAGAYTVNLQQVAGQWLVMSASLPTESGAGL